MSYSFNKKLSEWIEDKKITRKELISILQNINYEEFYGLDSITLSRWLNGKTTPPLYKQLYIAKYLDMDILEIISSIPMEQFKETSKISRSIEILKSVLENSIFSYNEIVETPTCFIEEQSFEEYYKAYSAFNRNIPTLNQYFDEIYQLKNKVKYTSLYLKNSENKKIGHFCGIRELSSIGNTKVFNYLDSDTLDKSAFMNVAHFKTISNYLELLTSALCFYILTAYKEKEYIFVFVPGLLRSKAVKSLLGIKEEKIIHNKDSKLKVYLFKVDIIKTLCNPLLFPLVQKKITCLMSCDNKTCNKCNLKQFM